jgi:hypothetical protein
VVNGSVEYHNPGQLLVEAPLKIDAVLQPRSVALDSHLEGNMSRPRAGSVLPIMSKLLPEIAGEFHIPRPRTNPKGQVLPC